jgi:chromosomal replication initiator protein
MQASSDKAVVETRPRTRRAKVAGSVVIEGSGSLPDLAPAVTDPSLGPVDNPGHNPLAAIWLRIAEALRPHVSDDTFQRWFSALQLVSATETELTLRVPNYMHQLWIETNYLAHLRAAILETLQTNPAILFTHPETDGSDGHESAGRRATARRGGRPEPSEDAEPPAIVGGMNPRNTFESFVVGSNCQFAHAAALAVAQNPSKTYNPLFIFGGSGLGKTHLMHAVGHNILERKKSARVVYLSSEQFTNEFIYAIQSGTLVRFRKKYRSADVLLIDDIQFFARAERAQEEFFHTFNTLFDGHKQIVLSCDRPANEIANLEQRLVSRFEWGLTAELQPPDRETRLAILRKKAGNLGIAAEPWVLEFIGDRIRSNVRSLEGALVRVAGFASLSGRSLSVENLEALLRDLLQKEARQAVTIDQIQKRVAEHFDIRLADMTSKRRPSSIAFPRQVAMYLARDLTKASLNEIGQAFGGRDHGTVLHAHRLVRERMQREESIRQMVSYLSGQLQR